MSHMDDIHGRDGNPFENERTSIPWKLIGLLIVVVALATFFLQNAQRIDVNFLWLDGSWPLWSIIGICVVLGVILDRLATWQWRRSRARRTADD